MVIFARKEKEQEQKKGMQVGKYELGRTLGEGNFGKVKFAKTVDSGRSFAVKILDKTRIVDQRIIDQVILLKSCFLFRFIYLVSVMIMLIFR